MRAVCRRLLSVISFIFTLDSSYAKSPDADAEMTAAMKTSESGMTVSEMNARCSWMRTESCGCAHVLRTAVSNLLSTDSKIEEEP